LGKLDSLVDWIYTRSKCERLIKYQDKSITFGEVGIEFRSVKISLGELHTEIKPLQEASEGAKALDDFQYQLCTDLENKRLDQVTWTKYAKTRLAANALILAFRTTLEAFKNAPSRQEGDNLNKIIKDIQYFVKVICGDINRTYDTADGRGAILLAIGSTDKSETEVDEFLDSKFKEIEERERKILKAISSIYQYLSYGFADSVFRYMPGF